MGIRDGKLGRSIILLQRRSLMPIRFWLYVTAAVTGVTVLARSGAALLAQGIQ